MRATDKILEFIKHIEPASKLISSSLGETDLYKAEYLTKHLRGLRDLQIGDVSLLLLQCKTEVESKNYADIISRLTKSCAEYISAFEYNEEDLKRCYSMTAIRDQAKKESLLARKNELDLLQEALDGAENEEDRNVIQEAHERAKWSCLEEALGRIKSIEGYVPEYIYDAVLRIHTAILENMEEDKPLAKEESSIPNSPKTVKNKNQRGRPRCPVYDSLEDIVEPSVIAKLDEILAELTLDIGQVTTLHDFLMRKGFLKKNDYKKTLFASLIKNRYHTSYTDDGTIYHSKPNDEFMSTLHEKLSS